MVQTRTPLFARHQPGGVFTIANLEETPGSVFFVDSTHTAAADAVGGGQGPDTPLATLDYAIGLCTANKGDVIFVMPGHVETVVAAAGLAIDVAGISIIGLGTGSARPKVNLTTLTTATVTISAANVKVRNILFTGGVDAIVSLIVISAADVILEQVETRDVTGQMVVGILTTAGADRLRISGWKHRGDSAAGADTALTIVGGDSIIVEDYDLRGNFVVAGIRNVTTATTNVRIGGGPAQNYIHTKNSADVAVTMAAGSTGFIGPNINAMLTDNAANITEAFVGAGCFFMQPINIVNLAGESSMQTNITASTDA